MELIYSNHAVKQMFSRALTTDEVEYALENGETVMDYPYDKPYPSRLLLAFCNQKPIHIVCSYNQKEKITVIITTYVPSLDIWENDYKTRKK
ncbi:MAG: DUF4258 domain-containing protein [Bacteroidota bacterium]|nr:DUF4258 domain-containing protein [Bacteroidota bacterium]